PQNCCDGARPGVAGAGSSGRATGAHRRTAVFRRADGRGNCRVTGNFARHGEAGLDPGENLASARTICELGIQILRDHKNYPIPAREHPSATLDRLKTILGEALEQNSSAARIALVERRCGQDTDLLEEAESLLAEAEALLKERTDSFEDCAQNAASTFWQEG